MDNTTRTEQAGYGNAKIDINKFIYSTQKQKKLNPLYIPLTKQGFTILVVAYVLMVVFDGGSFTLFVLGLLVVLIYKKFFPYRYHEKEHLWAYRGASNFINKDRRRTLISDPIFFHPEEFPKK